MNLHEDLKAYLDGELDPIRSEEMRAALERDPALRRELSELKSLSASLTQLAGEITPQGLEQTLSALTKRKPPQRAYRATWRWGGFGLAAAGAAILVAVILRQPGSALDAGPSLLVAHLDQPASAKSISKLDLEEKDRTQKPASEAKTYLKDSAMAPVAGEALPKSAQPKKLSVNGAAGSWAAPMRGQSKSKSARSRKNPPESFDFVVAPSKIEIAPGSVVGGASATGTVTLSSQQNSVTAPAEITRAGRNQAGPETVVLMFPSTDEGTKKVLTMVGRYLVANIVPIANDSNMASNSAQTSITVDLPEDVADKIIGELKALPEAVKPAPGSATRSRAQAMPPGKGEEDRVKSAKNSEGSVSVTMSANSAAANKPVEELKAKSGEQARFANPLQAGVAGGMAIAKKPPKSRRVVIVITEKPKPQPVP